VSLGQQQENYLKRKVLKSLMKRKKLKRGKNIKILVSSDLKILKEIKNIHL